jgi:aerobic carbon-monoxide dehydrogenase large subunit
VLTGTNPHGQGEETTFAQLVAEELGVPVEDVDVVHGDTGTTPMGWGTYGSRTTAVGGTAILKATRKVIEKAKKLAAHQLEAATEDIIHDHGRYHVAGSPGRAMTIQDIALQANVAWNLPDGMDPGLEESHFHDPTNFTFPFGTHICTVEVDAETGEVHIQRYIAVDDVGTVINPMIVDGQVHGGVAQGIGNAFYEQLIYSETGQLLNASFMDYLLPTALDVPRVEVGHEETLSPLNPMGVKGAGEAGAIPVGPLFAQALEDALGAEAPEILEIPLSPSRLWELVTAHRAAREPGAAGP